METNNKFKAKIRKLSQSSYGITVPVNIINNLKLDEGDTIDLKVISKEEYSAKEYYCVSCGYRIVFSEDEDRYCPACQCEVMEEVADDN